MPKRQFEVDILAPSFIKKEGLATQYLKADGSVDFGQRIVEDVNIGQRNFESNDRFKTLIGGDNPRLNLLGNVFQINDEVEIYGQSRIQIIETDTYLTINYLGVIYDINNPDISIPTNAKAWLKCVDLGIFILSISEPNSGGTPYTNEQSQDAVGTIVADTTFINLDYNDATPSITASLSATGTTGTGRKYLRDDNTWAELDDNSYIQRPVKFITTATYNFIATDEVKTLIVENTDGITNIYLNQNIFVSGDEIEIYDKSNSHKTYIYPGVNVSIFHQGTNYLLGTSFSFGSYQKIWLKCTGVNKFDVVFVNSDTETGGGTGAVVTTDTLATLQTQDVLFFEDFLNNNESSNLFSSGFAILNGQSGQDGGGNSQGCAYLYQPSLWVDGMISQIYQSTNYVYGLGDLTFKTSIKLNQLSTTNSNRFTNYIGFINRPSTFVYIDSLYFSYDAYGTSPSLNWKAIARNNSSTTIIDTGVPVVANQFINLKIIVKANLSVEFYINNILVHTRASSAGIHSIGYPLVQITVNEGNGQPTRSAFLDYFQVHYKLTNPR